MSVRAAIVASEQPFVEELLDGFGIDVARIDPQRLEAATIESPGDGGRVVWIHLVPTAAGLDLDEAALLLASVRTAQRSAEAAGASLTFLALVPSRGLFAGPAGLACDLARGAFEALMQAEIGAWSARGDRIAGVVYAGVEGHTSDGQRAAEEVRQRTPIGSASRAEQLADALRYLGSERAGYVTGTLLRVDGGWNAYSWIYPARTI